MACSTSADGTPLVGRCCPPDDNPCPPDRIWLVANLRILIRIFNFNSVATQAQLTAANDYLVGRFAAEEMEDGSSIFIVIGWDAFNGIPTTEDRVTESVGVTCGISQTAYWSAGEFASPDPKSKIHANKMRIGSASEFCLREIPNGTVGPQPQDGGLNISPPAPNTEPGGEVLSVLPAGIYDLIPDNGNPVIDAGSRATTGNNSVGAYAHGAYAPCDAIL